MSQVNDMKHDELNGYFIEGALNKKEYDRLFDLGCTTGTLMDRWFCYLRGLGHTGTYNDMLREYLVSKGYIGTVDDATIQALLATDYYAQPIP